MENQRLLIVNVFAAILAGSAAAYKEAFFSASARPAQLFLMLLSVFGVLFSIKIDAIFKAHTHRADSILTQYGLPPVLASLVPQRGIIRYLRISRLFPTFFAGCFCFLLAIILKKWEYPSLWHGWVRWRLWLIIPITLFVMLLLALDRLSCDATPSQYPEGALVDTPPSSPPATPFVADAAELKN